MPYAVQPRRGAPPALRNRLASDAHLLGVRSRGPIVRELREIQHQLRGPFLLDSSLAEQTFGLTPHRLGDSVAYDIDQNWSGAQS